MEFGKLEPHELEKVDFTLPPDNAFTTKVLQSGKGKTKFYIGCAKWGRKDWIGKLYPKGTKEKDFLRYYASIFNSLEFNALFYNLQSPETVRKWKESVPKGFKFCPKFTQSITHFKRLKNAGPELDAFLANVHELGDALGPVFLMPHPQMGVAKREDIELFVQQVPKDVGLFVEFRHPSWYEQGYDDEMQQFLNKQARGTIITDAAGRRDCAHMQLSTPECFIRFVGNSLHPTDYARIDAWVQRLKEWIEKGLEKCYFFMHQHEELHSPELIRYFIEQMNKHCGTTIPLNNTPDGNPILFES
jgi:uncharacterized protein YecE (DUF72 family)